MKRAALIYNLLIISIFITAGLINASKANDYLLALLFVPPLLYFSRLLSGNLQGQSAKVTIQTPASQEQSLVAVQETTSSLSRTATEPLEETVTDTQGYPTIDAEYLDRTDVADVNRRLFLKLIGGASVSAFMMSIFTDKTHAAFFGSMPVPGAMSVKNSAGELIDPAEKQPTDGYEIAEIDDTDTPAYYGFIHKTGAWYISREDANGSYRYTKGMTDFPTNWTDRTTLTYDYFDNVF
jgi:hypothetical protein